MKLLTPLALALVSGAVLAQPYPGKPVRFLVPFPAAGAADIMSRIVGKRMSEGLGQPVVIGRAVIDEAIRRVQAFELQYMDGQQWRTLKSGTRISNQKEITFPPVTASRVRLNITKATDGPTL